MLIVFEQYHQTDVQNHCVIMCDSFLQLTDILFAELPRVRLDPVRRPLCPPASRPTLREVPEESETSEGNSSLQSFAFQAPGNLLGKLLKS